MASLGVEPRWASPVDFESTASTSSATRPANAYDTRIVLRRAILATIDANNVQSMKHCPACGNTVQYQIPPGDQRERAVCSECGQIHYQNPRIIAGCVVEHAGLLLLCRRAIEPRRGYWTHPAGFMELGETLQHAAARETREEALAEVQIGSMLTVTNVLHTGQVHIHFRGTLAEPVFGCGTESLDVQLFEESRIPWDKIAFQSVEFSLRRFLEDRRLGRESLHFLDIP